MPAPVAPIFKVMKKFMLMALLAAAQQIAAMQFTISLYDQQIYHPGSSIRIKASIMNDTASMLDIRSSSNRAFNIEVRMMTLTGQMLEPSQQIIIDRNSRTPYFYRDIALDSGEEFSFIFELSRFVDIAEPGIYLLEVGYRPEMNGEVVTYSNRIYVNIRPGSEDAFVSAIEQTQTAGILTAAPLPPDEVVDYLLSARINEQWSRMFLYLDPVDLLMDSPLLRERYLRANETERMRLVEDYREQLITLAVPGEALFNTLPNRYTILRTSYTENNAEVTVRQEIDYGNGRVEVWRYSYFLERRNNIWFVVRYLSELMQEA